MAAQSCTAPKTHEEYTVGWVCALPKEQTAATAMLDQRHANLWKPPNDPNTYTLGSINKHNVVIACLPRGQIGQNQAATVAARMISTFPSIKFGLMVGIGGGIPTNVRLGDVVVSTPVGQFPGVVQWDFGKAKEGGTFERTGSLNNPPTLLLTALSKLETEHDLEGSKIPQYLEQMKEKWPRLVPKYLKSDSLKDILFRANYTHISESTTECDAPSDDDERDKEEGCRFCDKTKIVKMKPRDMRVHFGLIASGNQVIKDAVLRDRLNDDLGGHVLCVEMEAAGLMNNFPCIIVRGICDYADSHKNNDWQEHAAAVAAAFAKELLEYVQPSDIDCERPAKDILDQVLDSVSGTAGGVESIRSILGKNEYLEILDWLTPIDYGSEQSDNLRRRQAGTGQWLLDSAQYQTWLKTKKKALFCPGIPGAGKTILTSIVVDDLNQRFFKNTSIGIAYIYCDFRKQSEQTADDLLASLLRQLAGSQPFLPACVNDLHDRHKWQRTRPLLDELSEVLQSVVGIYSRVFIVVDALDECQVSDGSRSKFLSEIFSLQIRGANIFATSRPIPEITENFEGNLTLQIHAREEDVRRYLDGQMFRLPRFVTDNVELQEEIKTEIINSVDGMFLLAKLHLELLVGERSPKTTRMALKSLPTGSEAYNQAYDDAMNRIEGQVKKQVYLAKEVLSWIICARRTLSTTELQHALAVEVGTDELDKENLPQIEYMVSVCAGLVTVDKGSGIIRLVHYTTQEYFERTQNRWFPSAEIDITKICATYLSFSSFECKLCKTAAEFDDRLKLYPLYGYAARNWGHHAYRASTCPQVVIQFLEKEAQVEASGQALNSLGYGLNVPSGITGLHLSAYFGIEAAVKILYETVEVDVKDKGRRTPLSYAAENGHDAVVKLLLEKGAGTEAKDNSGWAPLSYAAENGHDAVVKLLLKYGADIGSENSSGRTPLLLATLRNHESLIKILVEHNASVVSADRYGDTPLRWARMNGSEAAAMLLLEKDTEADSKHNSRLEMFHWAADSGHEKVLSQQVQNGIDVNCIRNFGNKPSALLQATSKGHEAVVKILLEAGANVNMRDTAGDSPLSRAAYKGNSNLVQLILSHGANPNAKIGLALIPLVGAVLRGHQTVVKLLLENGADANSEDGSGRTPLVTAALKGHQTVVKLLLENGADANSEDGSGWTPLVSAMLKGHQTVVKLLLKNGADVNSEDRLGHTPLSHAAASGREEEVELLLKHNAEINFKDAVGCTPLWRAAEGGHEGVTRLLLQHGPEVNFEDNDGNTPLSMAVMGGRMTIAKLFLEHGADILSTNTENRRTLLSWAAKNGDGMVVRLLVENGISVDSTDIKYSRAPLCWAAGEGNYAMVKLLLASNADVNLADSNGQTPLLRAAESGYDAVVKLLLASNADVNLADSNGQTPLFRAATHGHEMVVKMLLEYGALLDSPDSKHSRTPLSTAAVNGRGAVVKLLLEYGTNADSKDHLHRTPLMLAALNGHETIVRLLLSVGAKVDSEDVYRRTPLFWAVYFGNLATAAALLEKNVDPNSRDKNQRTMVGWAIERGQEAMVKLLLDHGANADLTDEHGRTPLCTAAEAGHIGVVKLLVGSGAYIDPIDVQYGQSPLWHAADRGHTEVVKLLLDHGANPDLTDEHGRTPLCTAAEAGHIGAVKLLLSSGAYIDPIDVQYGQSPLWRAAERGHAKVVNLLLASGAEVDLTDNDGRTPLSRAVANDHEAVVNLLQRSG